MVGKKRAIRRAATLHVRDTRIAEWLQVTGVVVTQAAGCFRSHSPWDCGCSKRKHGRPRVDSGVCNPGERARIYRDRAAQAAVNAHVRAGRPLDTEAIASFF
jgi:hypothetical protein